MSTQQPRRKTTYVSVQLEPVGRAELNAFLLEASRAVGKRLSQTAALRLALAITSEHLDEAPAAAVDLGLIDPPASESEKESSRS